MSVDENKTNLEVEKNEDNSKVEVEKNESNNTLTIDYNDLMKTDKSFRSFIDAKVTNGIKTAVAHEREKWQLEQDTQKSEAEKLAQMNEEQKRQYELNKIKKENADLMAKMNAYNLEKEAVKIASEKGVNTSLLSFIDFSKVTAEELNSKIDILSTNFSKAVENEVNNRLKEKTPISANNISNTDDNKLKDLRKAMGLK